GGGGGGGGGGHFLPPCTPRSGRPSHHQLRDAGPGLRPRLRAQPRTRDEDRYRSDQLLRLRRHQRYPHLPPVV
ncbi:MAG: 3-oxoacyl-[acyl-carrier-protein] synthase, KASII (EC 2.3.1.179), partial [Olavius algarvensis Gamma 1 endosymbiont]